MEKFIYLKNKNLGGKTMSKKRLILPLMIAIMLLSLAGLVRATTTCEITPSATIFTGALMAFNVTVTDDGAEGVAPGNFSNTTVYMYSTTTENNSVTQVLCSNLTDAPDGIGASTNGTAGALLQMDICDTTIFIDSSDYIVTATISNTSDAAEQWECTPLTSKTSDNTVPSCDLTGIVKGTTYETKRTWTLKGGNATSANIEIGTNGWKVMSELDLLTTTTKDNLFEWNGRKVPEGVYTIYGQTSDGYNTTICTSISQIKLKAEDVAKTIGTILAIEGQKEEAETRDNTTIYVLLVILVGYYFYKKKK